jgi:hypothetical protein
VGTMTRTVPSWQRALALVALGVAILLFLLPVLRGSEIFWPNYRRAIPILAVFAVALVPFLLPRRLLRPELVPIVASLGRVALFIVVLLVIWEAYWVAMHPLF